MAQNPQEINPAIAWATARGITPEQAAFAEIEPVACLKDEWSEWPRRPGALIYYHDSPFGERPSFVSGGNTYRFARARVLGEEPAAARGFVDPNAQPKQRGRKPAKYLQLKGSRNWVYWPKVEGFDWGAHLKQPGAIVGIVEGEAKALCLTLHGFPTVGIGGVDCIRTHKGGLLIPDLVSLAQSGVALRIIFDNDIAEKPDVQRALRVLAAELRKVNPSIEVKQVELPVGKDEPKGADDFIVAKGIQAFAALAMQPVEIDASPLPINVAPHRLLENLELIDQAIADSGEPAFQRGGELVFVEKAGEEDDGEEREPKTIARAPTATIIKSLSKQGVRQLAMRVAKFERYDKRAKEYHPADCSNDMAQAYMEKLGGWRLPELDGIVEAPTLRADGSVLQTPGYDAVSRILFVPSAAFPEIPGNPTREEAEAALERLRLPFREFGFAEDVDVSVLLAAVLTAITRKAYRGAPMFGFGAHRPREGKSLLCSCVGLIATGHKPTATSQGGSPEEDRKRMLSILRPADPVALIDNCIRPIEGDALCSIITEGTWADRLLCSNTMVKVDTRVTLLASGNKLTFSGDMCERSLLCQLDSRRGDPEARQFDFKADEECLADRPELVAAGLTIVRAYLANGAPHLDVKPWGGFEDWQRFVQKPLVWLGCADPCATRVAIKSNDPDREMLEQMIHLWRVVFGKRVIRTDTFATLGGGLVEFDGAQDQKLALRELAWQVSDSPASGELNKKKLGHWLKRNEGVYVDGVRVVRGVDDRSKSATWAVR